MAGSQMKVNFPMATEKYRVTVRTYCCKFRLTRLVLKMVFIPSFKIHWFVVEDSNRRVFACYCVLYANLVSSLLAF